MTTRYSAPHPTRTAGNGRASPVATVTPLPVARPRGVVTRREVDLHGLRTSVLEAGADSGGPVVVLVHGLASSARTWAPVLADLGRSAHVIAPDLLGHGRSAKPRGADYSLGAHATRVRDLLLELGVEEATVIGHSFGGGVAARFAHQFPEFVERIGLIASCGLGRALTPALRAAALPGAAAVLQAAASAPRWLGRLAARALEAAPARSTGLSGADLHGLVTAFESFADPGARAAFLQTVRGALDGAGQRVAGNGRLTTLEGVPVLLVAGTADPVIPVAHSRAAHRLLRGSRLHVFDGCGHFPHVERPLRFTSAVSRFLAETVPARDGQDVLRGRVGVGVEQVAERPILRAVPEAGPDDEPTVKRRASTGAESGPSRPPPAPPRG